MTGAQVLMNTLSHLQTKLHLWQPDSRNSILSQASSEAVVVWSLLLHALAAPIVRRSCIVTRLDYEVLQAAVMLIL